MKIQKIYNYASLGVIILLLIMLLFRKAKTVEVFLPGVDTVRVDTLEVTTVDTLWRKSYVKLPKDTAWILNPFDLPATELVLISGSTRDSAISINYTTEISDSTAITDIDYILLKPETIEKRVEREILKTQIRQLRGLYAGGGITYDNTLKRAGFNVGVTLTTKKGAAYTYDYDILSNIHSLGFKYKVGRK